MKRALVLFGNEIERENLINSAIYLQKEFGFKIYPLYIKDMAREKLMATTDGLMVAGRAPFMVQGWDDIERGEIESIKNLLKAKNVDTELKVDIGLVPEIVTEHMKRCDLLIMGRNDILTENEVNILKGNYKSILLIGEKPLSSMQNILIGNDNGVKVNRSCYHFMTTFPEINNFSSFVINKEIEENILVEYLKEHGKNIVHEELTTNNYEEVLKKVDEADLFIMGNLSRSYFFEKIIGKNGIKLLEKGKAPIFIG
jgi:hypothetical protein